MVSTESEACFPLERQGEKRARGVGGDGTEETGAYVPENDTGKNLPDQIPGIE